MTARVSIACLLLVALLAGGCAVIDAGGGEERAPADCRPIVQNGFDDAARWAAFSEPGASVVRERDVVRIRSAPSEEEFSAYADLHSKAVLMVAGTELDAAVTVADPDSAVGGISWTREADDDDDRDYYDLVVSSGSLVPLRREVGAEQVDLCDGDCPPYDPVAHALFRLRASGDHILYEVSDGGGEWTEVARAPRGDEVYGASAYVYAETPAQIDASFARMTWASCEP